MWLNVRVGKKGKLLHYCYEVYQRSAVYFFHICLNTWIAIVLQKFFKQIEFILISSGANSVWSSSPILSYIIY